MGAIAERVSAESITGDAGGLARALAQHGVGYGDRVAVMLPNCAEYLVAGRACARLSALLVPVNSHLKTDEVAWILEDSQAKVLLTDGEVAPPPGCVVVRPGTRADGGDADLPDVEELPSPAFMFYTSGTTGRPKGVVHGGRPTAERQQQVQDMLKVLWGFTPDDVYLLCGPAYHAGPGGYAFSTLYNGGDVVVMPSWDAREFLRLVDEEHVTTSFMTPAHFIRILEVPEDERVKFDLSSLRLIIHGGAPCPVPVKERIIDVLAPGEVHELYGASEGGATRITPDEWRAHPGSVGTPWPGTEILIVGEDGELLPAGQDGVVYIRPPGGLRFEYHNDAQKTDDAWRDDAFTVGDIGHLDADGYLYITDRVSDMVLWGGVNVYPREIEEVLHAHPDVVDCAVFGIPDDRYGEVLKAVVETRTPVDADALRAHVRERLADYKVPSVVEFVDELPRDPNGKVLKRLLK
ncbi:MAG TPA: AMP-binding protein [Acidimicrobiales bacterium]|nr:AMP-binding protein [Acidimicrobiales bacterium]